MHWRSAPRRPSIARPRVARALATLTLVALPAAPFAAGSPVTAGPPAAAAIVTQGQAIASCTPPIGERERLLSLGLVAFDRSDGGWRPYGAAHCYSEAANLIADYVEGHAAVLSADDESLLRFHSAQMLADADRNDDAVGQLARVLNLDAARAQSDPGWRFYVQGSIDFLRQDRPALDQAVVDLKRYADGESGAVQAGDRLNLNALHGLQKCFGRNYAYAYGAPDCRDFDEARGLNKIIG